MKRLPFSWSGLAVAAALLAAPPAEAALIVRDLGTLGGTSSSANGINASGQVVGNSWTTGNSAHRAFLYSGSAMTDLGTFGGTSGTGYSHAYAINDSGQVVGGSELGRGEYHAFLYSGGVMNDLGSPAGRGTAGLAINNSGQVVGGAVNGDNEITFLYSGGVMTYLGYPVFGNFSTAQGINDSGAFVGWSGHGTSPWLYSDGVVTRLNVGRGTSGAAYDINNSGQIVGNFSFGRASLYSDGDTTDLGTVGGSFSTAYALNDSGQVVGDSEFAVGSRATHGFLYRDGAMIDLNSLIEPDSGWTIISARGINDRGQIAANGYNARGEYRALRLDPQELAPVPEPSTLAMGGTALVLLGLAATRRRRADV